jgi:hypothetical protein
MDEMSICDVWERASVDDCNLVVKGLGSFTIGIELFDFYAPTGSSEDTVPEEDIEISTHVSEWSFDVHPFIEEIIENGFMNDMSDYLNDQLFFTEGDPMGKHAHKEANKFRNNAITAFANAINDIHRERVEKLRGYCDSIDVELTEEEFDEVCQQFFR